MKSINLSVNNEFDSPYQTSIVSRLISLNKMNYYLESIFLYSTKIDQLSSIQYKLANKYLNNETLIFFK